jgi:hypothetical protein
VRELLRDVDLRGAVWAADAGDIDFPQVTRVARIRRDRCDTAYAEDGSTGYRETAPRSWPRCGISPSACSTSPG